MDAFHSLSEEAVRKATSEGGEDGMGGEGTSGTAAETLKEISATETGKSEEATVDAKRFESATTLQDAGDDSRSAILQGSPAEHQDAKTMTPAPEETAEPHQQSDTPGPTDIAAAEGGASPRICGNESLEMEKNQGDGEVEMADVTPAVEAETAAAAAGDQSAGRKRCSPDQESSPAAKRKKPRGTRKSPKTKTTSSPAELVDTIMADESVGESAPAKQEPPATRRSGRRAAPTSYKEDDIDAEFDPAPTAPSRVKAATARGGARGIWAPDHLLQDPKSKLVKADITTILKDPRAWSSLTPEQQSTIIALLPNAPVLAPDPDNPHAPLLNIPQLMLASNNAFKADIAMFQEDLREGRLDPGWQHDGMVAMERRARGEFDAWKEREVEAFWGQKQKLSYDVVAGESGKIKLETLVAAGCWEVGDVWVYARAFGKAKGAVKVEKEATITSITEDNRLRFRFPDGQRKFSSATAGADVDTEPIEGLQDLADAIIAADGRTETWRGNNAWKEIRCFRKNQDIGSPWEIRENFWARQQAGEK